jgi:hypothetical protein
MSISIALMPFELMTPINKSFFYHQLIFKSFWMLIWSQRSVRLNSIVFMDCDDFVLDFESMQLVKWFLNLLEKFTYYSKDFNLINLGIG